jgi:stage II sporulation protein AA (anti-sigma F factor antagonist)
MGQENVIQLETIGDVILLDIQGDVTVFSEPHLKGSYGKACEQGANKILLRFQQGSYINSGGIAVLIQLLAETKKKGQQIAILGLSDHFKKIFGMVGITKFARIHDTVEDALKGISEAS